MHLSAHIRQHFEIRVKRLFQLRNSLLRSGDNDQNSRLVLREIPFMHPKLRKQFCRYTSFASENEHRIGVSSITGKEDSTPFRRTQLEVSKYVTLCRIAVRRRSHSSGNFSLQHNSFSDSLKRLIPTRQ